MSETPIRTHDYVTITHKNKRTKNATPYFVTAQERKELITELGDACFIVFSYYMEKASVKNYTFKDLQVAKALGFTLRKVKRARLLLTKHGWFYQSTYSNYKRRKVVVTLLGSTAVTEHVKNGKVLSLTKYE